MTNVDSPSTGTYKLELRSAYGPVYRDVLRTPPRDCNPSEVPIIDLSNIYSSSPDARKYLAATIRNAAENTGFFYIKNHGIPEQTIHAALAQAKVFFAQPVDKKRAIATSRSAYFNGWTEIHGSNISPTESRDYREGFAWRYDPKYDPEPKEHVPEEIKPWIRGEEFVWCVFSPLNPFHTKSTADAAVSLGLGKTFQEDSGHVYIISHTIF